MKTAFVLVALAVLAVCAMALSPGQQEMFHKIVEKVNSNPKSTWTAEYPAHLANQDFSAIRNSLGALIRPQGESLLPKMSYNGIELQLPDNFDATTNPNWATCKDVLNTVPDQSACGSCWAVSSAQVASTRKCIATNGKNKSYLSARDLMSCCDSCGFGCQGGYPDAAFQYLQETGLVTGSSDNKNNTYCVKYPFLSCMHHTAGTPQCSDYDFSTPECQTSCDKESTWPVAYPQDKVKFSTAYSLSGEQDLMNDLYLYGPIGVAFSVYSDFEAYKSGVYKHTTGDYLGGHAVTLVGWGVDTSIDAVTGEATTVKYWRVQNNWNNQWGEAGYFRIVRGNDECGIESQGATGHFN